MPKDKILLVDDEEEFIQTLSQRIKARGLKVETTLSGKEALEKVKSTGFDAILLDLFMPGMDGIETLKHLKKINPELQVILITGHATIKKCVEAMKSGAMDFLEKPSDIKELLSTLEEASAKTAILVEKRVEKECADIIRRKGW